MTYPADSRSRAFLGIMFRCCRTYCRVYVTADGQAYAGHCPRCAQPVRIDIGPGGTQSRFFEAG